MRVPGSGTLRALAAAACLLGASAVAAAHPVGGTCRNDYRDRRITLVVPYVAGGGYDQYARAMAPLLQRNSGARVTVSNLPSAGGEAGAKAVADGDAVNPRIGLFEAGLVLDTLRADDTSLARFSALAMVAADRKVWNSRPGFDPLAHRDRPVVASVYDVHSSVAEVVLAAHALGIPLRFTLGYKGSGDRLGAVMRGEVDVTPNSLATSAKAVKGGDVAMALLISDRPDPALPGVPWLAGPGGLVERANAGRSPAERAEAMRIARDAVDASPEFRSVFVSSRLPESARACLASLVWEVISGDEFALAMAAVGRPVHPADRRAAQQTIDRVLRVLETNRELLQRLIREAAR